jgi:tRNA pseudouridine55 synthase
MMDGIIIVKKEEGCTSHDVVSKVKKILKVKVGHTGTLDPMATGVLPLLLGEGTKLSKYLIQHDKIYEATMKLGEKTDTADAEGKIVEKKEINENLLNHDNIEKALHTLLGKQKQKPPIYSAIKINGKKLYEYARNNQEIDIPEREIEIFEIKLLDYDLQEKTVTYKVHCSKGTYIRSLCETIAQKLGTVGYMKKLNRVKVGEFSIDKAISVLDIYENSQNEKFLKDNVITIEKFFYDKPSIKLQKHKLDLFLNGVKLTNQKEDDVYRIYDETGKFIGTGTIQNKLLKRDIII